MPVRARHRCAVLALLVVVGCTRPSQITPSDLVVFTTDGCSGGFPEGVPDRPNLWCDCCVKHDLAYWKGGTAEQRKAADAELRECVIERGKKHTGKIMEIGVTVGGSPYWPTSYRWGYGWPYGRGYTPVTPEEEAVVAAKSQGYEAARRDRCGG